MKLQSPKMKLKKSSVILICLNSTISKSFPPSIFMPLKALFTASGFIEIHNFYSLSIDKNYNVSSGCEQN